MRQPEGCQPAFTRPACSRAARSPFRNAAVLVLLLALFVLPSLLDGGAILAPAALPLVVAARPGGAGFDHPTRTKILSYLEVVPGDNFRSIARGVQVSTGEARHHLNILIRRGRVREFKANRCCRYYVVREGVADRNETFQAYWTLRECRIRVLRVVQDQRTVTPSEVATALGISRQLAGYHLQNLSASGRIRRDRGRYHA